MRPTVLSVAECATNLADTFNQTVFGDDDIGSHGTQQLVFADQQPGAIPQIFEHVKGVRPQCDSPTGGIAQLAAR